MILSWLLLVGQPPGATQQPTPLFSESERIQIVTYWNAAGRSVVQPPDGAAKHGLWQVRLTPDGSRWFLKYQVAIGAAKAPPTQAPTAIAASSAWKTWVDAKLAYDRRQAQQAADAANSALNVGLTSRKTATRVAEIKPAEGASPATGVTMTLGPVIRPLAKPLTDPPGSPLNGSSSESPAASTAGTSVPQPTPVQDGPPSPGPIPPDLLAACGDPPPFAAAVIPMQTCITFDDGDRYTLVDNVKLPPSYAYYRFPQGTDDAGTALKDMPDAELDPLFAAAGFTPSEQRIVKAVSKLEGGFDSVNTYDTGYVSIGFIQYITAVDGKGDLLPVLQREKSDNPNAFASDFHAYGIDVTPDGVLEVVDPATGAELNGADAVMRVICDKRLTAVFQRAGRHSRPFRVAQIEVVKTIEWPADDPVVVTINGVTQMGKVSDVVKSEAGMTTLFDRKVNRGSVAPFQNVLQSVMQKYNLTNIADAAKYEREIIAACRYRVDYLKEPTLSQPSSPHTRMPTLVGDSSTDSDRR